MAVFINNHTTNKNGNGFYILDLIKTLNLNSAKIISLSCQNKNSKIFTLFNKKKASTLKGKILEIFLMYYLILKNINHLKNQKIIFTSDPPMIGLILIILKKCFKCEVIFWCQDIFPNTLIISNIFNENSFLIFILKKINQYIYKNVDIIVTISASMKNTLMNDYGINKKKIKIFQNWNSLKEKKLKITKKSKINIFYNGNIGMSHDQNFALNFLNKIKNNDLKIKIYTNSDHVSREMIKNYLVKGFLSEKKLLRCILKSDFQMIFSKSSALTSIYPSKIYNFLFYKKPILYFNQRDNDEISKMIKKYNIGISINNRNEKKIISLFSNTNKIRQILKIFKKNYKKFNFNKITNSRSKESWKKLIC